ncbi:MAG: sensor histidine kinase, partial [Fibrobacterota bacterium]|nr:ATP-binding protein [Chitinispirillaceae bacterium]
LVMVAIPLQNVLVNKLKNTLELSTDPNLEPLLRSFISTDNDSLNRRISLSIERNRQWHALIPYIVEEQSIAMLLIAIGLFALLFCFALWSLKKLTKPLKNLAVAADKIGNGIDVTIVNNEGGALGKLELSMVTMQKELVKLREKAHALGMENAWRDIARVMAHEIKNPLTPIQLTLDRITDRFENSGNITKEEIIRFVERISSQVGNLERLVNDFRSFAKDAEPSFTKFEISESISTIADDMQNVISTVCSGRAQVIADKHLVNQILLNIWKNSIDAGAKKMVVNVEHLDKYAVIHIRDDGCGIPEEHLERVWIPYITFKKGGTGLGLPVVKRLVESMNGSITLTSSTGISDHGVTLHITLLQASM